RRAADAIVGDREDRRRAGTDHRSYGVCDRAEWRLRGRRRAGQQGTDSGFQRRRFAHHRLPAVRPRDGASRAQHADPQRHRLDAVHGKNDPDLAAGGRRDDGLLPVVAPTIRSAAIDRTGRVWIVLVAPFTYVFDRDGDKVRTVQFRAAGIIAPDSLFFTKSGSILMTPGLYEFPAS